jgi:hypothetical protein
MISLKSLAAPHWDDTAILFITTHGLIIKEEDQDVNTFIVPEGIIIKRALASVPGQCNIVGELDVNAYVSLINAYKSNLMSNRETTRDAAVNDVMESIKRSDTKDLKHKKDYVNSLQKFSKYNEVDEEDEEHLSNYQGYIREFEKGFTIQEFNPGDTIIDKKYIRTNFEATKNDWIIKVMNIPGTPDLLSFLRTQTRGGDSSITLKEIVDFLIGKGVKNIIIFDLTCSNIATSELVDYDSYTVRAIRRDISKRNMGGKNKKRTKNKRMTKKKRTKNKRITKNKSMKRLKKNYY